MSNFHPLEVVGRGSETQLQVTVNLNMIKGLIFEQVSVKLSKWTSDCGLIDVHTYLVFLVCDLQD